MRIERVLSWGIFFVV